MKGETRGKAVPHYLKPTASSRAKQMTQKKVENKAVAPLRKLYVKSNDPDDSVPVRPSVAKTSHEVKETLQEDEKRRPLYLATTAFMRTKTLPTKKYVKRESRLPPRMMLKKRTMSSSEASEEEKKKLLVRGSRYRHLRSVVGGTQAEGGREERRRGEEGDARDQFGVSFISHGIEASPCVAIKKASTNPPTKILTFVTSRRGGDASTSSDEELDRELLAFSHKDNPCPCERE